MMKASAHDNYLAAIDCFLINIPLKTGYSPTSWQSVPM